jgi:hypothetical protein
MSDMLVLMLAICNDGVAVLCCAIDNDSEREMNATCCCRMEGPKTFIRDPGE